MSDELDLGDDHRLVFAEYKSDKRTGASVYHKRPDGSECAGWIAFEGGAWAASFNTPKIRTWKVEQADPLTLSPSLLCGCGDHGWIRNGRWVRC